MNQIFYGDNLALLPGIPDSSIDLIYIDPPFNTGKRQECNRLRTIKAESDQQPAKGDRVGFKGQRYTSVSLGTLGYADLFDDYLGFLIPRLEHLHRILKPNGSFFLHLDYREVHYAKVALDQLIGREHFMNEIIWAYDYGARSKSKWSCKHDTILWYAMNPKDYTFNFDSMDRIPYMAPGLVGEEKAKRGKTPTDVWWHTIVPTNGKERTGYATQKPLGLLERLLRVHSNPGDRVLDFFAGSSTTGEAAARNKRLFTLIDQNPQALEVMQKRFATYEPIAWHGWNPKAIAPDQLSQEAI
ncbi:MAG: DNA-methyltransferase [Sumerlaeia bacterium]